MSESKFESNVNSDSIQTLAPAGPIGPMFESNVNSDSIQTRKRKICRTV